jgi:hypothetical protein
VARRRRSVRSEEKALLNSDSNHGRRSRKMKAAARRRPLVVVVLVAAASLPAGLMTRDGLDYPVVTTILSAEKETPQSVLQQRRSVTFSIHVAESSPNKKNNHCWIRVFWLNA